MNLEQLGWNDRLAPAFTPFQCDGYEVGRIASEHRGYYTLYTPHGELNAEMSGALRHRAAIAEDFPVVGDWVVIEPPIPNSSAVIHHILPRQSKISRKVPSLLTAEQIIAANLDTLFLISGLDHDFNLRRIERYLILAWESGANPVVVFNKIDCCADRSQILQDIEAIALGVPILWISALHHQGLDALQPYLKPGKTVALLGSSGVGKSTLTNALLGRSLQAVQSVRQQDSHGRHTTTHRQLFLLPSGGILLDTPGLREVQLWATEESLTETFQDIAQWATLCRFRDCRHDQEPGCAVQAAIANGSLSADRLASYQKLQKELDYLKQRKDERSQLNTKKRWKAIHKAMRHHPKRD